jgi:hypothetical protein
MQYDSRGTENLLPSQDREKRIPLFFLQDNPTKSTACGLFALGLSRLLHWVYRAN